MADVDDLERRLDDFEQRLNDLEDTVTGPSSGLERRLDELEQTVDGRGGLEGDVQDLKKEIKDLKDSFRRQ